MIVVTVENPLSPGPQPVRIPFKTITFFDVSINSLDLRVHSLQVILGGLIAEAGARDRLVVLTKCTYNGH